MCYVCVCVGEGGYTHSYLIHEHHYDGQFSQHFKRCSGLGETRLLEERETVLCVCVCVGGGGMEQYELRTHLIFKKLQRTHWWHFTSFFRTFTWPWLKQVSLQKINQHLHCMNANASCHYYNVHHAHTHHSLWEISIDGFDELKKPSDLEKRKWSHNIQRASINTLKTMVVARQYVQVNVCCPYLSGKGRSELLV